MRSNSRIFTIYKHYVSPRIYNIYSLLPAMFNIYSVYSHQSLFEETTFRGPF